MVGAVHGFAEPTVPIGTWDEKLDAVGRGAVKTVQSRCRLVAHHRARSESEEAGHQSLLNRWWRTDQAPDTRGNPIQPAISHPPVQLVSRHLEPVECLAVDDSVVLGKKLSDFVPLAHSSMGVARSEEGKRRVLVTKPPGRISRVVNGTMTQRATMRSGHQTASARPAT